MDWSQRLQNAVEYIEGNIDEPLDLDSVAKMACCSKFHFHRLFLAHFGVTFSDYVRKRRLTLAAVAIANSEKRIVDIALDAGFDSPNAFTRAFRKVHGINPSQARKKPVTLSAFNRAFFAAKLKQETKMDYKIIDIPGFKLVGKSKEFEFDDFVKTGPKFWKSYVNSDEYQALMKLSQGLPGNVTNSPLMSVYFPKEGSDNDEFLDVLGIESLQHQASGAWQYYDVPGGRYAEFSCNYKTSMKTNRFIYGEWFKATGFERDDNKPDIAAYFPIPFRPMAEMGIRWWIPIVE